MIYLVDGKCEQCKKESDTINVLTKLCVRCTASKLLNAFEYNIQIKTGEGKLIEVNDETKSCPKCDSDIDISVTHAFENDWCPYCGFGIKRR